MPYEPPSFEVIRSRALRDIRSQLPDADITSDSDNHVRASSVSAIAEGIHQQAAWTARQIFPDSADFDELKRHAASRDVYPKSATASGGALSATGKPGALIGAGLKIRHTSTGTLFTTVAAVTIPSSGKVSVQVTSDDTGSAYNGLEGACTFVSPPLNVDGACTLSATVGGTDDEKQESLLARYLDVLRNPPSEGNEADYRRWALAVDGVSTVLVIPKRRGGNTVDIVITSAGGPSSTGVIAACHAAIDAVAPAGADVWVFTPVVITVDVSARLKLSPGYQLSDLQSPALTALSAVVGPLKPLDTLYRQRLSSALSGLPGVVDLELDTPSANIAATELNGAVRWVRLGAVSLGALDV